MLKLPEFKTKKELFDFLVENKESLIAQKCSAIKEADGFGCQTILVRDGLVGKAAPSIIDAEEIRVKVVINTTNIMDSHDDVHIKGLWNKSLKENKRIMHVQEHKSNQFDKIISSGEDLKAFVKDMSWKDLGYNAEGDSEALIFDSLIKRSRNEYMLNQYKSGYVSNHSVGMQYVKLDIAINDKEYEKEMDFFNKYIETIVNKQKAIDKGYFWVVTEAKAIEGSAVPNGSNPVTPTIYIEDKQEIYNPKELAIKHFLGLK